VDAVKQFHIGDILSVTTGYLVAPRGVKALYDLLDYMTGDNLFTHQLPRAAEECKPVLLEQHPNLAAVVSPEEFRDEAHVWAWLGEQVERYGMELPVGSLASDDHTRIDPITELKMMKPDAQVVVVEVPEGGAS
jgi:hypothetical protein